MSIEYLNGVGNFFGPRAAEDKLPAVVEVDGEYKQLVLTFNYDDLPTYGANGQMNIQLPANTHIKSAVLQTITAAAGGTSYVVGLYQPDSTVIDADGLLTAATLPTANLTAGSTITGTGALIGASIGAAAGQIVVAASGTFTAGKHKLIVEYRVPATG
jgi:hypothetical protein